MLPTLDYDDMVKVGSAQPHPDNIKDGNRKYAVIIKNAHTSVGKFDITDKPSVEESIYSLTNNTDIPEIIRKSAEYYTKMAADFHGVEYDISTSQAPHEIIISDIVVKTAEHEDVPMISFGEKKFILSDEENIKLAEEYFLRKSYLYPAAQRINVSRIIVKAAAMTPHIPDPVVTAYATGEYGNNVKTVLTKKASLTSNEKYASIMSSLCKCYSSIPVPEFLDLIDTCDKVASVRHDRYGISPHDFLVDSPRSVADELGKSAAQNADSLLKLIED